MLPYTGGDPLVELRGITKRYGSIVANDHVDFQLRKGEIHGLLGENGAGKTTLASVLAGLIRPDEGTIILKKRTVTFSSPRDAMEAGVGMVHQHFMQVETMTVAENILLGEPGKKWRTRNSKKLKEEIRKHSHFIKVDVDPDSRIRDLSIGERQRAEILKVLFRGAEILVLDEPTSVLTSLEVEALFESLRQLSSQGKSIILIAHKLNEILSITDSVTVLRRGALVGTRPTKSTSAAELAEMMVGARPQGVPRRGTEGKGEARARRLVVENLVVKDDQGVLKVDVAGLVLNSSEILGIAGVDGNGQRELAEALTGLRRPVRGRILMNNDDLTNYSAKQRRDMGVGFVPEDRLQAIVPEFTILENLMLTDPDNPEISKRGLLQFDKLRDTARRLIDEYGIKATGFEMQAANLSGGNIQRLILARELSKNPKLLVVSHPTRGLDISATRFVHESIRGLADSGSSIIVISSDLDELMELSDRIVVIHSGKIMGEFESGSHSVREIGLLMTGAKGSPS